MLIFRYFLFSPSNLSRKSNDLECNSRLIGTSDFDSHEPLGECNLRNVKITSNYYSRIVREGRAIFYL